MYCTHCGKQVATDAAYCPACGGAQPSVLARRRLVRPHQGRKIAGVCLGVANYLDLDVTLVRLLWVILTLVPIPFLSGLLAYIVGWFIIPNGDDAVPAVVSAAPSQPAPAEPHPQENR